MAIFGSKKIHEIKKAQKEKQLYKEISQLFFNLALDTPALHDLAVSRVSLSDDKGVCTIYFYTPQGEDAFEEQLEVLKLYRPSLRKAIASSIRARYTPELIFKYDEQFAKGEKITQLLDKIKREDPD